MFVMNVSEDTIGQLVVIVREDDICQCDNFVIFIKSMGPSGNMGDFVTTQPGNTDLARVTDLS